MHPSILHDATSDRTLAAMRTTVAELQSLHEKAMLEAAGCERRLTEVLGYLLQLHETVNHSLTNGERKLLCAAIRAAQGGVQ